MPILRSVPGRDRRPVAAGLAALALLLGACTIPTGDDPPSASTTEEQVDPSISEEPAEEVPTAERPLVGKTVFLDPAHGAPDGLEPEVEVPDGHGGTVPCAVDASATDAGYGEDEFVYETARILAGHLRELGADVVLSREDPHAGPCLHGRAEAAAEAGADLAVVLHADAGPEAGFGFHVAHADPPADDAADVDAAWAIRDALADRQLTPSSYTGEDGVLATAEAAELNLAGVPTVLVQLANPANTIEGALLPDPTVRSGYARALRDGVVAVLTAETAAEAEPAPDEESQDPVGAESGDSTPD